MPVSDYATAPFDHAKADIILRSSDNVYFRVFKLFLSLASPVFETLFNIPQPKGTSDDQEIKDGLCVIPLTEDSKTLGSLLRFCYPCTLAEDPRLEVLKDIVDVLEAARKYSLDAIGEKSSPGDYNSKDHRGRTAAMFCDRASRTLERGDSACRQLVIRASVPAKPDNSVSKIKNLV